MSAEWLAGLTKLRVLLIFAGLAWFFGLDAHLGMRIAIGTLGLMALLFDGLLDEQRTARTTQTTVPPQRTPA
ncbi:hypothetical protein [Streptomyces sp. WAC01280]|uniref:hypothetical protein n=1 Tax=Streptomyces sp. WAC01280 TaxID=2487424 RepID=UPI000F784F57|nr:hypothetical protein [Streptomyces sp. WAC01280]RSS59807.1 hypothetical protein EF909_08070 [Streptomyces sp. WAC01280]